MNKLELLKQSLKKQGLDGFLVPRSDAWPGEFVSKRAERLGWLSGFTGSAGIGIVLQDKAAVLTDGRYTLQVGEQTDSKFWQTADITKLSAAEWLLENAEQGAKIGFDPYLHSQAEIEKWEAVLNVHDITLNAVSENPIDDIWTDQPVYPDDAVYVFPKTLEGESSQSKIKRVCEVLKEKQVEQFIFTMPDSIAWLLNIRGNDVEHTPVPLSYGALSHDGSFAWFIAKDKVPNDVIDALSEVVHIRAPQELDVFLNGLNSKVGIDDKRANDHLSKALKNAVPFDDPCIQMKACKNEAEQEAIRQTHIKDGKALVDFHGWLKDPNTKKKDELTIERHLEDLRQIDPAYRSPSFDTIAGYQGNGAIIHYRADKKTNKKIKGGGMLLVDSGGQYLCDDYAGTTDVTRTYILGEPTDQQMHHYTLVLKAHIAIARAKFPYGTTGVQIDSLARHIFWEEGLDFAHGLGHGVGCFLNVHEEAAHLSPRGKAKLEPGMLLSNEPGLYFEGEYGIRIENLMFVQKTGTQDNLGRDMLCFETVTLAPYDKDLIDFRMLGGKEMKWLESYYRMIEEKLG